ncbi:MAG TPA: hypothetical protein VGH00_03925, partial [Chthoniobacterales bacterium]
MENPANNDCFGNIRAVARRDLAKRWARRLAVCGLGMLLVFGSYRGYGAWRKHHLSQQAQDFLARNDYASAVLVARHLLQLDPVNVAACRIMAETASRAGKQEAVSWCEQVVALEPSVAANRIALANTALRFGRFDLARRTLDAIDVEGRGNVKYHELAGTLAIAEKNPVAAESEFAAALQLDRNNRQLVLNLATVRLTSSDSATREKARADLALLVNENGFRLEALRALTTDALATKSLGAAQKWAAQLQLEKSATFSDLLLYVEATKGTEVGGVALRNAEAAGARSPALAAVLITWMNRHEMARRALDWALTLPDEILHAAPVPLAVAECHSFLQDWTGLHGWVDGKDWRDEEFLRLAVLSHSLHHLTPGDRASMESQTAWNAALKATNNRADRVAAIARLAEGWDYAEEAADAWWLIA